MTREEAFELVHRRLGDSPLFRHCLATEACMRALAERFGEDRETWGIAGLVHDLDLDECEGDMERHALVGAEVLRQAGAPDAVVEAVLGHNDKAARKSLMAKALWVVDPTTGMIAAAALISPSKSTQDLTVKSIEKRMKDKRFAAAVSRDQIRACESLLGLSPSDFLSTCLGAINSVRGEVGL